MKYFISIILFSVMTLLTVVTLFSNFNKSFFAGGSEALMKITTPNFFLQILLLLICGFLWHKLLRNFNVTIFVLCISVFMLWLMSGRTIGVFPDGKIKTGWFYFATNEINVCVDDKADCESVTDYQTTAEKMFFWRVRIKNKQINQRIFIGPFVWSSASKMLQEGFGAGKYTQ